jgi:hypothetical protein
MPRVSFLGAEHDRWAIPPPHLPHYQDVCRQAFKYFDSNRRGELGDEDIIRVSQFVWRTINPECGELDGTTLRTLIQRFPMPGKKGAFEKYFAPVLRQVSKCRVWQSDNCWGRTGQSRHTGDRATSASRKFESER